MIGLINEVRSLKAFLSLSSSDSSNYIFDKQSAGVKTNRDAWVYRYGEKSLIESVKKQVNFYNEQLDSFRSACSNLPEKKWPKVEDFVDSNKTKISWSSTLLPQIKRGREASFFKSHLSVSLYRPYVRQFHYSDRMFNDRSGHWNSLFPTERHKNLFISVTGVGSSLSFSCLISAIKPDYELISKGQCFPLYYYEKLGDDETADLFGAKRISDRDGYVKYDAISDVALNRFLLVYNEQHMTKEDVFYYIYGLLHSPLTEVSIKTT